MLRDALRKNISKVQLNPLQKQIDMSVLENINTREINWIYKMLEKLPLYAHLWINLIKLYLINPIHSYKMNQTIR